jgi:hypothetical protein
MKTHKFETALLAFTLMLLPPIGMYFAAQSNATIWIWGLIAIVVSGNIIALAVK